MGNGPAFERLPPGGSIKFKCIRCDVCCGTGPNVSLTIFDIIRMAYYTNIDWRQFIEIYVDVIIADMLPFMKLSGIGKGRCPFLRFDEDDKTYCSIYPARPMKCRLYPFIVMSPSSEYLYVDRKCPGIGEGGMVRVNPVFLKIYQRELREHYRRLYRLVMDEGYEPLQALYKALSDAYDEAKSGADWFNIEKLSKIEPIVEQ
ncbi:MAG: YkgJ family cysteine cluster protein [Desulfurococcales archaeon]|nr:YkgJ family cysteine cluster protein [Desulfurococcales archaeon]MEB3772902.1 YkgJ family cysteine cluster protein [Desulfurococcales archaeon]MEB3799219.1 YkgJ family cysteine cluster protein [Desulfurococcales archaeon]